MEKTPLSKRPKVFYGYWIVVASFLCVFISQGSGYFAFSLFVRLLEADLGWSRGAIMVAFSIFILTMGVASMLTGRMVDRYGVRRVIAIGAVILGLGFVVLSLMNSLWHFYLGYVAVGVGAAAMGIVPSSTAVSNWFSRKRGLAIGVMSSGIGAGGLALALLVGGYLIPNFGWRTAYLAIALLAWVLIIPLALLVVKTKPSDMGLYPDGVEAPEAVDVAQTLPPVPEGVTLRMAFATSTFWLVAITFILSTISNAGVVQSQVPHLEDIGFPLATAATALGIIGLGSAIGKVGFGWLCDWIPAKYACAIGIGLRLGALTIFMSVEPASSQAMIWLYAITLGLGNGSWLPTMSILVSTSFGLVSYGAIFGMVSFIQSIGAATGPLMAGFMYDTMNTYHWAFIIFLALYVISIPTILAVRRKD